METVPKLKKILLLQILAGLVRKINVKVKWFSLSSLHVVTVWKFCVQNTYSQKSTNVPAKSISGNRADLLKMYQFNSRIQSRLHLYISNLICIDLEVAYLFNNLLKARRDAQYVLKLFQTFFHWLNTLNFMNLICNKHLSKLKDVMFVAKHLMTYFNWLNILNSIHKISTSLPSLNNKNRQELHLIKKLRHKSVLFVMLHLQ